MVVSRFSKPEHEAALGRAMKTFQNDSRVAWRREPPWQSWRAWCAFPRESLLITSMLLPCAPSAAVGVIKPDGAEVVVWVAELLDGSARLSSTSVPSLVTLRFK